MGCHKPFEVFAVEFLIKGPMRLGAHELILEVLMFNVVDHSFAIVAIVKPQRNHRIIQFAIIAPSCELQAQIVEAWVSTSSFRPSAHVSFDTFKCFQVQICNVFIAVLPQSLWFGMHSKIVTHLLDFTIDFARL